MGGSSIRTVYGYWANNVSVVMLSNNLFCVCSYVLGVTCINWQCGHPQYYFIACVYGTWNGSWPVLLEIKLSLE